MTKPILSLQEVLKQLRPADRAGDAAVAEALGKSAEDDGQASPWFVRGLVALSAWIAAILFLSFVFGTRLISTSGGSVALGIVILVLAVVIRRAGARSPFLAQLGLALSMAGQALFIGGVGEKLHGEAGALAAVGVSIALIIAYPDRTHRFLSTVIAVAGAAFFMHEIHFSYGAQLLIAVLAAGGGHLWFHESRLLSGSLEPVTRPVAYGVIAGLFLLLIPSVLPREFHGTLHIAPGWLPATTVLTALLLSVEYRLLAFHDGLKNRAAVLLLFAGTVALAAVSYNAPGIIAALLVLAIAYHRGNRILTGMAFAFLAVFLSAYYYNVQLTLLAKSYALLASGAVLLLLRLPLLRALPNDAKGAVHE
jgi:uncharacterized membrane protein